MSLLMHIYGYHDVKIYSRMAIQAERPVASYVRAPGICKIIVYSFPYKTWKGHITPLEVVRQNLESLTICLNKDRAIS